MPYKVHSSKVKLTSPLYTSENIKMHKALEWTFPKVPGLWSLNHAWFRWTMSVNSVLQRPGSQGEKRKLGVEERSLEESVLNSCEVWGNSIVVENKNVIPYFTELL